MVFFNKKILLVSFTCCFIIACQQDIQLESQEIKPIDNTFIEANGELASSNTAMINPPAVKGQWQYKITFLAPEGSEVSQGQPLVKFDASKLNQDLSLKMSQLKTAKQTLDNTRLTNIAKLEKEKLNFAEFKMQMEKNQRKWQQSKRLESNLESKKLKIQYLIAQNDTKRLKRTISKTKETNKIKLAIANNNAKRLESEIKEMQSGIKRMTVLSPKSGVVIYKPDFQGEKVSSGDSVWMGRQIIGLPSLDSMIVKSKILEADAGKVSIGQKVEVTLDAAPERVFIGKISKIGKVFREKSRDQPNIIFDAEINLEQPDADLMRPGMAARLKIFLIDSGSLHNSESVKVVTAGQSK
jgi:HlyD family secretion protein